MDEDGENENNKIVLLRGVRKSDSDITKTTKKVSDSNIIDTAKKVYSPSDENEFFSNNEDDPDPAASLNSPKFEFSRGLTTVQSSRLYEKYGPNALPEKVVPKWYIFVSQLWQPMPIMIWLAAIVEAAIQNWLDMGILLFIQFANASIGYYEITKAGTLVFIT